MSSSSTTGCCRNPCCWSLEGEILASNPAACELFGRSPLAGVKLCDVSADAESKIHRLVSLCQRSRELLPGAVTVRRPDGSLTECRAEGGAAKRNILLRLLARDTTTGRFLLLNERIETLHKEIAERQRVEAALRRANADLQQFAYTASHDLKEPLRMVGIYSELLQRKYRGQLDEEADEYLSYTIQGAQRMDMLVRDLLAYTQAVSEDDGEFLPANTSKVLVEAIANLKGAINESDARIHVRDLPPPLAVKHVHLVQLFQNIIGNAIKYRAAEPAVVELWGHQEGAMWRICVHDNGIGISPAYCEQVFGLFKRLHSGDRYPGTGIGLAICQKIVHRYGGRIWVESEGEGRGSTFCFTLPGA